MGRENIDRTDPPNKGGRPSSAQHPTLAVKHIDSGEVLAWSDGVFSGSPRLVKEARLFSGLPMLDDWDRKDPATMLTVDLMGYPEPFLCDTSTPEGAMALMLHLLGGRGGYVGEKDLAEVIPGWPQPVGCIQTPVTGVN